MDNLHLILDDRVVDIYGVPGGPWLLEDSWIEEFRRRGHGLARHPPAFLPLAGDRFRRDLVPIIHLYAALFDRIHAGATHVQQGDLGTRAFHGWLSEPGDPLMGLFLWGWGLDDSWLASFICDLDTDGAPSPHRIALTEILLELATLIPPCPPVQHRIDALLVLLEKMLGHGTARNTVETGSRTEVIDLIRLLLPPLRETALPELYGGADLFARVVADYRGSEHAAALPVGHVVSAALRRVDLDPGSEAVPQPVRDLAFEARDVVDPVRAVRDELERYVAAADIRAARDLVAKVEAVAYVAVRLSDSSAWPDVIDLPAFHQRMVAHAGGGEDASDDPVAELEALIGLEPVKQQVRQLVKEVQISQRRREAGLNFPEPSRHALYLGSPGTAKTTVARLIGRIYRHLGLLSGGQLVEVSRDDLIADVIGGTGPLVAQKVEEALGGVLFIDEAYALVPKDSPRDFGHEAVSTLLKLMEDHRDELVVIAAGYRNEMNDFVRSNSGLASRFPIKIDFPDYSDRELVDMVQWHADKSGLLLPEDFLTAFKEIIPTPRPADFANGRWVRNLLEASISRQAIRLDPSASDEEIRTLVAADLPREEKRSPRGQDDALTDPMAELESLTGLASVKAQVRRMRAEVRRGAVALTAGDERISTSR